MAGEFRQGLFGCFSNCGVCIITFLIPCYTEGKVAEKVGESCLLHALFMFVPILNLVCASTIRQKVREQKGITGSFVGDLLTLLCCGVCAMSQEATEVDAFGSGAIVRE
jgi:Cys-rich protein (TIGR01571 family)